MPFMDGLSATRIIRHLEQGLPLEEELPPPSVSLWHNGWRDGIRPLSP